MSTISGGVVDLDPDDVDVSGTDSEIQSTDSKDLSDYIGGGAYPDAGVEIGVDDSGRATETITTGTGGPGSTNSSGPDISADPDTDPIGTVETDESLAGLEKVEQAVEQATKGAAFGDPGEIEDIGSGEAVTTVSGGGSGGSSESSTSSSSAGGIPWKIVGIVAIVGVVGFAATNNGGE